MWPGAARRRRPAAARRTTGSAAAAGCAAAAWRPLCRLRRRGRLPRHWFVPILPAGQYLGVAATDLLVADLERVFAPWLSGAKGPWLLLNFQERVIVSNALSHNVGDVIRANAEVHTA